MIHKRKKKAGERKEGNNLNTQNKKIQMSQPITALPTPFLIQARLQPWSVNYLYPYLKHIETV